MVLKVFSMRLSRYIIAFIAVVVFILIISVLKAGREFGRTFDDMLFIAGAILISLGAFIFALAFSPSSKEAEMRSRNVSDRQVQIYLEHRRTQKKYSVITIIFGLAFICLSVAIGTFL
jgi:Na+/glutamate symporter